MSSQNRIVTIRQLELLTEFMRSHVDLARGRLRTKAARALSASLWVRVASTLNAQNPNPRAFRSPQEWNKYYNDYKRRVRNKWTSLNQTDGGPQDTTPLSPLEEQLCQIIFPDKFDPLKVHKEDTPQVTPKPNPASETNIQIEEMDVVLDTSSPAHQESDQEEDDVILTWSDQPCTLNVSQPPKQHGDLKAEAEFPELPSTGNQLKQNYTKVFKRCIALIVKHGRPAELLDDQAFQDILSLIPLRQADRKKLTGASITAFMESNDIGAASSYVGDNDDKAADDGDDHDDSPTIPTKRMKVETNQCTCNSSPHDEDCPAWSTDVYWSFYEVSIDEATCKLCSTNIKWSHMVDLKEHLKTCHPDTPFEDDDDVFDAEKTTADSDNDDDSICKPDESNDIYLEDPLIKITHSTKAKKRKNSTTNSLNDTEKLGSKSAFVTSPSRSKNDSKPNNYVTLKDSEMICLERFKSLDRFGLYIASLMKLLPKDKSDRLQEQIVQRLIREQAAAG